MAKLTVNIGETANDRNADSLRTAFSKINENFTELYTSLGLNENGLNLGAFEFTGSTMSTTDSSSITLDQSVTVSSDLTIGGDVLPSTANGGNLGSVDKPWKSLYVSDNTIYIGGNALGIDDEGELVWNNSRIAHANGEFITLDSLTDVNANSPNPGDTIVWNGGAWVNGAAGSSTGDITFNGVKIIGAGTASGDGAGYSTLELVPDNNLYNNNQYLVIDPTAPSHIHIRAGGTQDNSNAELYLGGERNNARINDYSGVKLNNNILNSTTTRQFDITTDFTNATWSVIEPGVYYLMFRTSLGELQTVHDQFGSWPDNTIVISDGTTTYTLTYNGYSGYLGNPNDRAIQVREAPPNGTTVNVQAMTFTIYTLQQNYLSLEYSGFEAVVNQDINLFSNQTIRIATGTGNIQITADDNNTSQSWYFTVQGYLQFPQGLGPTTSKGKVGDEAGSVVVDADYIYYCHTDYTDGIADIWKRTPWSQTTW